MRYLVSLCLLLLVKTTGGLSNVLKSQDVPTENNVFLITLDGFRWQELFSGADSAILSHSKYTQDTTAVSYWDHDVAQRRQRLLPFFWNVVAKQGQLFGNRTFENKVNVTNLYQLSYPGYNEILTGRADPTIYSNERKRNQNTTLLEYLNTMPAYNGKVAAFTSWNAFPFILNEKRSNVYVNCTFDEKSSLLFKMKKAAGASLPRFYDEAKNTRNDWATFFAAQHYIKQQLPNMVFIGLGGTDEYAHQKKYGKYLQQAAQADRIIAELWNLVQSHPYYKDRTTFIITTDHGRGSSERNWYKHGFLTEGSSQTWMAMLGAGIKPYGEMKIPGKLYQDQVAGTVSALLGVHSFERESIPVSFYTVPLAQGQ
jgi:hypothetical protein